MSSLPLKYSRTYSPSTLVTLSKVSDGWCLHYHHNTVFRRREDDGVTTGCLIVVFWWTFELSLHRRVQVRVGPVDLVLDVNCSRSLRSTRMVANSSRSDILEVYYLESPLMKI